MNKLQTVRYARNVGKHWAINRWHDAHRQGCVVAGNEKSDNARGFCVAK